MNKKSKSIIMQEQSKLKICNIQQNRIKKDNQ